MKKKIVLLFLSALTITTHAQKISGIVMDNNSNPLEFVNIVLLNESDSAYIDGTVTNSEGAFTLKTKENTDLYLIKISFIGYKTYIGACKTGDAGTFVLHENAMNLSEVVVSGSRPLIKQSQDRIVFNVKNMKRIEGLKGLDMLKYAPRVIIGIAGSISIGNKDAVIYVNDRRLSGEEAADYLQNLDAKEIDRIEVQQSHGAEKDAEIQGGIIHIFTKNDALGLSGNVGIYGSTPESHYYSYRPNTRFYFGTSKWNIYGNYSYLQERGKQYSETINHNLYNQTTHLSSGNYVSHSQRNLFRIGSMLLLNQKHSLGVEFNGVLSNPKDNFSDDNITFTNTNEKNQSDKAGSQTRDASHSDFYNMAAYYNYKIDSLNSFLKILFNYNNKTSCSNNILNTVYSVWKNYNISEQNKTFSNGENFSGEMDFRKNFHNKWSFRTGGKLLLTQRDSRLNTIDALSDIRTDSNWDYRENIEGGYIGASKEITPDMFAYISLRAENTHIKGKSSDSSGESLTKEYTNWFPYVYFSHTLSSKFSYDLTYTKNIFRPPFSLMNGYSNRISDILYDKGNPELKPELTDVFTLSAKYGKHSSSLTYRNTSNAITEFFEVADNITYHTNINYGETNSTTLDYNYNGNLLSWWQTNFYLAGLYTRIPESYNRKYIWGGLLSWNNRFFFEKTGEFSLGLDANTPTISGNAYHKGAYFINIAYSRSFCKDALNVRIGINDLFNSWKIRSENHVPTLDYRFYAKNQTRQLWCSITYNFSIRSKVSKERLINNNTIENRL